MRKNYTVISFGNYETKILVCTDIDGVLLPIYQTSFITKNCYKESKIIDVETLVSILTSQFDLIPINLKETILILNIPIKELEIVNNHKESVPINDNFTQKMLLDLVENFASSQIPSQKMILEKKVLYWKINNESFDIFPSDLNNLISFGWNINSYLIDKSIYDKYFSIFYDNFNLTPSRITCDSLVLCQLFQNKERKNKILVNIGHSKTLLESYENNALVNQLNYDFGISHLTCEISELAHINEEKAIELLTIYKDIAAYDENLALVNHFKPKYLSYYQTTVSDIKNLILNWIKNLIKLLNYYVKQDNNKVSDEIYLCSSMNILDVYLPMIAKHLEKKFKINIIKPTLFGINEAKYCSLIATIISYLKSLQNPIFQYPNTVKLL